MNTHQESYDSRNHPSLSNASKALEKLLNEPGNRVCADCGSPDPKWVSLNHGVFICIKCSGIHRSLGVHISKVFSINLDEWTDDRIGSLIVGGGNAAVNMRYETFLPEDVRKPKPDTPLEDRLEFIRRKYTLQQFSTEQTIVPSSLKLPEQKYIPKNKHFEKQHTGFRQGLAQAFRKSWKKKDYEQKTFRNSLQSGMVEFVGLIKVNIIRGTNLAIRDVLTSDPYIILTLGHQTAKTRVVRRSLNPVWNESLMLSIPDPVPPLRLQVYDKDTFSADDKMGDAEIDIRPLISAAKAYEHCSLNVEHGSLVEGSVILFVDGKVKQEIDLKLQNVESGELEIELECMPLSQ